MNCLKKIVPGILVASIAFADNGKHNEIVKAVNKMDASHVQKMIESFKIESEHDNIRRVLVEAVKISDVDIGSLTASLDPNADVQFAAFNPAELKTLENVLAAKKGADQSKKDEDALEDELKEVEAEVKVDALAAKKGVEQSKENEDALEDELKKVEDEVKVDAKSEERIMYEEALKELEQEYESDLAEVNAQHAQEKAEIKKDYEQERAEIQAELARLTQLRR